MKRLILGLGLAAFLVSCAHQEPVVQQTQGREECGAKEEIDFSKIKTIEDVSLLLSHMNLQFMYLPCRKDERKRYQEIRKLLKED